MLKRKMYNSGWSQEELDLLRYLYPKYSNKSLSIFFDKTVDQISCYAGRLGLSSKDKIKKLKMVKIKIFKNHKWEKYEDNLLTHLFNKHYTIKQISSYTDRTEKSIKTRCYILGLKRKYSKDITFYKRPFKYFSHPVEGRLKYSCIYSLINTVNNKRYIAYALDLHRAINALRTRFNTKKGYNIELINDFEKYGEESFEVQILHINYPGQLEIRSTYNWLKNEYKKDLYNKNIPTKIVLLNKNHIKRFYSKLIIKDNGCMEHMGKVDKYGYIPVKINNRKTYAHRLSYLIHFGEFDPYMKVCHKCDNKKCCNPDHLFLGTDADNNHDYWMKKKAGLI